MAWTYDITTNRGKVRFLSTDSDTLNQIFDDSEIDFCLTTTGNDIYEAAALTCETWARSQSKIAISARLADGSNVVLVSPTILLMLAQKIRDSASNSQIAFGLIDTTTPNDFLESYHPSWRGIYDLPVVE